jgi:hypothetical protein
MIAEENKADTLLSSPASRECPHRIVRDCDTLSAFFPWIAAAP